ncbi:hypothetical protein Tco_0862790 [Tanacetum coccineum]
MTNAQANKDMKDAHVTLTAVPPIVQQQSSFVSSDLVSKFINPSPNTKTPSCNTTIPQLPFPIIQPLQQTPETTTTTIPTTTLPDIPNFASLFRFEQRVSALETKMSEFKQTNQFTDAVSSILDFIDNYLASKMKEPEYVQAQVSKIMPKIEKYITESLGAEVLVRSTNQPQTSYAVAASLLEFELKKILIDEMEENKSINSQISRDDQDKDEDTSAGSNRGSKRRRSRKEVESSKELTHKESKSTSSSKGISRSQLKSSGKSAHAEEHGQKVDDLEEQ